MESQRPNKITVSRNGESKDKNDGSEFGCFASCTRNGKRELRSRKLTVSTTTLHLWGGADFDTQVFEVPLNELFYRESPPEHFSEGLEVLGLQQAMLYPLQLKLGS